MTLQVQDNYALLDLMNSDMEAAPALYKPTNYWSYKANFLQPALKEEGLKDFRRKAISVYASIGGVDVYPKNWIEVRKSRLLNNRILRALPFWEKVLDGINGLVNGVVKFFLPISNISKDDHIDLPNRLKGKPEPLP